MVPLAFGADLPPEIQIDRLMVQAERETRDGSHWSAAATLERVRQLLEQHSLEIPVALYFQQGLAYNKAGLHQRAIDLVTVYLQKAGRDAEDYRAALQVLDASEAELERARLAQGRAVAEAERREREAAIRQTAISAAIPEMVAVPAGRGVGPFELSKFEVTFAQYDVCVEHGPCQFAPDEGWGREERPVVNVSWHDSQRFAAWLSEVTGDHYRLPSDREWTHAAGGGSGARYSWGKRIGRNRANCAECGSRWDNERSAPVGSFAPNAFGLHDMHGNVSEWVQNCYRLSSNWPLDSGNVPIPLGHPEDRANCKARTRRGGSWASKPKWLRTEERFAGGLYPDRRYSTMGFRVARSMPR